MKRAALLLCCTLLTAASARSDEKPTFPFKKGDRVAWVGSSSTKIGVWPKTMEFLLRTRHPELKLTFERGTTGGGTFATGLENLDKWLADIKPTIVVFNYGGNDSNAGEKGLPTYKSNIEKCVEKAKAAGARVAFTTNQAADVRKSKEDPAKRRKLYAETLLTFAKEKGWLAVDVFHPLERLQNEGRKADEAYTILKDTIHLTDPAYIAWGCFLYGGLNAPAASSEAALDAAGKVTGTVRCRISDVKATDGGLSFLRSDEVLPLLPPVALPPRNLVPLEALSEYRLKVTGLPDGMHEVRCEGKPVGVADAKALAAGINLNSLLLDSTNPAPWEAHAKQLWAGKELDQVGKTSWRFEVRKR